MKSSGLAFALALVHAVEGTPGEALFMMSVADKIELFLDVVHDLRVTNAITLASLVVLVYDTLLTFSEFGSFVWYFSYGLTGIVNLSKVKYVWKANWSYGKALFFLNRYPVVVVSVILMASDMNVASSLKMCEVAYRLDGWSMLAFIVPVQLIFCLRTTALWERNRRVQAFLVVLTLACDSIIAVFIWMSERIGRFMLPQTPGLRDVLGCYADMTGWTSPKVIIPAVAALMTFDAVILVLTLWRMVKMRKDGEGNGSVVRIFLRDGLIYYVVVLASSIANLILYDTLQRQHEALIGALVPVLRTVMSVSANRLMLNLRGAIDHARAGTEVWSGDFRATESGAGTGTGTAEAMSIPEETGIEMQRRLGPALAYEYRRREEEPGSPETMCTVYRPRSTTVVEVVTASEDSGGSLPFDYLTVVENGAAFEVFDSSDLSSSTGVAV